MLRALFLIKKHYALLREEKREKFTALINFRRLYTAAPNVCQHRHPSVCLSIRMYQRVFQQGGFPQNFITGPFMKSCRESQNLVTIGQKCRPIYVKTQVRFITAGHIHAPGKQKSMFLHFTHRNATHQRSKNALLCLNRNHG